jgi:hypothetical protein
MIKFVAGGAAVGKTLIGLGISGENVERLKKGAPISIDVMSMGLSEFAGYELLIFYGETEEKLAELVSPYIGPSSIVHFGKRSSDDG